jgi:hypothetical protein
MSMRRKIAVLSVISFGISAVLVACFRLIPLFELNASPDLSYVLGKMVIVAAVEIQLAIIAVNLPSLKAVWVNMTGGSSAGSGKSYSQRTGYKISSMTGDSHQLSIIGGFSKRKNNKASRGNITRMERGLWGTESEEKLFKQTRLKEASNTADAGIIVTRKVAMRIE